jgi:hypothetical protein
MDLAVAGTFHQVTGRFFASGADGLVGIMT